MLSSWGGKWNGVALAVALAAALPAGCGGGAATEETGATDGGHTQTGETAPKEEGGARQEGGDARAQAGGAPAYYVYGRDWLAYSKAEQQAAAEAFMADNQRLCEGGNPSALAEVVTESYESGGRMNVPAYRYMKQLCRQDRASG